MAGVKIHISLSKKTSSDYIKFKNVQITSKYHYKNNIPRGRGAFNFEFLNSC